MEETIRFRDLEEAVLFLLENVVISDEKEREKLLRHLNIIHSRVTLAALE